MTPTPTLLLLAALFWTLPVTTAVLVYRTHDSSLKNVKDSLNRTAEGLMQPRTQTDA